MSRKPIPRPADPNPSGLCMCGCGKPTPIIRHTDSAAGRYKGQHNRFIKGHHAALFPKPIDYVVDPDTGCWIWQRQKDPNGYGHLRIGGRYGKYKGAHRVYYERYKGPIPEGLEIDHLCRVPLCVNPEHLEAVTKRENILRGAGPAAINYRKTHCKRGHPFSPENTIVSPRNVSGQGRTCRICYQSHVESLRKRRAS